MIEPEVMSTFAASIQASSEFHRDDHVLASGAWSILRADGRAEAADARDALDALDAMRVHSVLLRRISPKAVTDAFCDSRLTTHRAGLARRLRHAARPRGARRRRRAGAGPQNWTPT